jgi:uncharacterized membrane protein
MTVRAQRPASVLPPWRWWLPAIGLVLAVAGLAVSTYLTITHYASPTLLLCTANSVVNCEAVTTSPESRVFGIPVAVLGVAYFACLIVVNTPVAWRSTHPMLRWLRLGGAAVGVLFVAYLVSAELILIGKICLWCTAVHVITVFLAVLIVAGELGRGTSRRVATPNQHEDLDALPVASGSADRAGDQCLTDARGEADQ